MLIIVVTLTLQMTLFYPAGIKDNAIISFPLKVSSRLLQWYQRCGTLEGRYISVQMKWKCPPVGVWIRVFCMLYILSCDFSLSIYHYNALRQMPSCLYNVPNLIPQSSEFLHSLLIQPSNSISVLHTLSSQYPRRISSAIFSASASAWSH